MGKNAIYWAGDRGFSACSRWHDEETIKILRKKYFWIIFYPFEEVNKMIRKKDNISLYGKEGTLRQVCLNGIIKSSLIVAYLGSSDTGTSQELEFASFHNKPILGWNDSAIVKGEWKGRTKSFSQKCFMTKKTVAEFMPQIFPMNAMAPVFDFYIEFSTLGTSVSPNRLAQIINKEAKRLVGN